MTTLHVAEALLDRSAIAFRDEPFITETTELLRAVNERDLNGLLGLGDEDFSIIDLDAEADGSVVHPEWEPWLRRFFAVVDALGATTDSEITRYRAVATPELGYSVVEFRQDIVGSAFIATFDCLATIIWKPTDDGWKEARWHCSVVDRQIVVPETGFD